MLVDIFKNDLFSFTSLTSAVNKIPYVPQEISGWLPWNSEGVTTTSVTVEEQDGQLILVPAVPRGAPATQLGSTNRKARSFIVPHHPLEKTIYASSIQGVRQFGSDDAMETVESVVNQKQTEMQRSHALTWEFQRAGAITGLLKDADGSTRYNWFNEFEVEQQSYPIALGTGTTEVVNELIDAKSLSEDELGDLAATGYVLIAGKNLFRKITSHASVKTAFDRWQSSGTGGQMGDFLRSDNRSGFKIASDIMVVSYARGKVGATTFMSPDEGYLCPVAEGLYQTRFAPADTFEAANTVGLPLYSFSIPSLDGRGQRIITESNALSYVTRPRAIIKITSSN